MSVSKWTVSEKCILYDKDRDTNSGLPTCYTIQDQEISTKAVGKLPVLSPMRPDIHSADTVWMSTSLSPARNTRSPREASPSKSYRATAWWVGDPETSEDWLTDAVAAAGDIKLGPVPVGDLLGNEASRDGWRGTLVGCTFGRGGNSEQRVTYSVYQYHRHTHTHKPLFAKKMVARERQRQQVYAEWQ